MKMGASQRALAFGFAGLGLAVSAASANLVNNGSFETQNFSDWQQNGDTSFTSVVLFQNEYSGATTDGLFAAKFGPIGWGGISQTIPVAAGTDLIVSFDLANNLYGSSPNDAFVASFSGQTLLQLVNYGLHDWTHFSFEVVASSSNPVLDFSMYNVPDYWVLDNVQINEVPAPASLAVLGLAGLAGRRRRR